MKSLHRAPYRSYLAHAADDAGSSDFYSDDPAARERAVKYSRIQHRLVVIGMIWSALINVFALSSGASARLRTRSLSIAPNRVGAEVPYTLAAAIVSFVASLPLAYFGGWRMEHRFGLSGQGRAGWLLDQLKGLGLGMVISLPVVKGIYWVIRRFPSWWWAILSALTIPFTVLLVNLMPILILPLFNKFEPLRDRALAERIRRLAEAQGVHVSDVLQMDMSKQTNKANAFFTGVGNTKRIVMGDTLLDKFTNDEVEVVLAHELAHQVHRDIWKGIGLGAVFTLILSFTTHRLATPIIDRWGSKFGIDIEQGVADIAALPLLGLLLSVAQLFLTPLQNKYSRDHIEHPADRYALELTRKRQAFISAMEKLGRMTLSDPAPSRVVKWLLYSHPPIAERVRFGRSYALPPRDDTR